MLHQYWFEGYSFHGIRGNSCKGRSASRDAERRKLHSPCRAWERKY